jgi:(2Fe-2S) ferredoxin
MQKPEKHILVCASFRNTGAPQGACHKMSAMSLLQYLTEGLQERGIDDVMVSTTGCLKVCDRGPAMIVYPEGHWYGNLTEDAIDAILDAMAAGQGDQEYILQ